LFVRICGKVIEKFHLEKKMDAHIVGKYLPGGKRVECDDKEEPKIKTVMPASVLKKEDKWAEQHEEESYAENMQVLDASSIVSSYPEEAEPEKKSTKDKNQ